MAQIALVREVEPDDLHGHVRLSDYIEPIAWAGIYEGDELVGYGCVSRLHSQVWAHDLKHWGTEARSILVLYRFLIKLCKERGVTKLLTDVSDDKMISLYRALGWRPKSVILEGEL